MIAACPKCPARYRVAADRVSPEGLILCCAKCRAVFRVRAPQALWKAPVAVPAQSVPASPVSAPPQPVPVPVAPDPDDMTALRANAERLARIIVSDILLYYPEQVEAGLASGRLAEALGTAIEEGRGFFAQRVDPRVRDERDYILEEVQRVAEQRQGG